MIRQYKEQWLLRDSHFLDGTAESLLFCHGGGLDCKFQLSWKMSLQLTGNLSWQLTGNLNSWQNNWQRQSVFRQVIGLPWLLISTVMENVLTGDRKFVLTAGKTTDIDSCLDKTFDCYVWQGSWQDVWQCLERTIDYLVVSEYFNKNTCKCDTNFSSKIFELLSRKLYWQEICFLSWRNQSTFRQDNWLSVCVRNSNRCKQGLIKFYWLKLWLLSGVNQQLSRCYEYFIVSGSSTSRRNSEKHGVFIAQSLIWCVRISKCCPSLKFVN